MSVYYHGVHKNQEKSGGSHNLGEECSDFLGEISGFLECYMDAASGVINYAMFGLFILVKVISLKTSFRMRMFVYHLYIHQLVSPSILIYLVF